MNKQNLTDSSFAIYRGNIKIFGGFPNGGGVRDISANPVYLSGKLASLNSIHVMVIAGLQANEDSVIPDGLIVGIQCAVPLLQGGGYPLGHRTIKSPVENYEALINMPARPNGSRAGTSEACEGGAATGLTCLLRSPPRGLYSVKEFF